MSQIGRFLVMTGVALVFFGVLLTWLGKVPGIGRLPGDIYIRKGSFTFYFPFVTSILISLILSLVLSFFFRR